MEPAILILGGGINGASVARELILNGIPVCLVDEGDLVSGATAHSSRLIHGGVRYLEYAEFRLVREALAERERLLRNAPQFVQPLQFALPVGQRFGGERAALRRLVGLSARQGSRRGLWLLSAGLWLYDWLASGSRLPRHAIRSVGEDDVPHVDPAQFRWLCCYWDAQMWYPERYTLALLRDTAEIAAARGLEFHLLPYTQVRREGRRVRVEWTERQELERRGDSAPDWPTEWEPPVIVNASGAWGDRTLAAMHVESPRLIGGTKGSHFLTSQTALRVALGGIAIYAETRDGRMVFIIPYQDRVLVGTTDLPWSGDPRDATTTEEELSYLLELVAEIFPQVNLCRADIDSTTCGVRPLPASDSGDPGSISRDHRVVFQEGPPPVLTLVGGKLTTSRQLGELVADQVLHRLGKTRQTSTVERIVPGGESYPRSASEWDSACQQIAGETGWEFETVYRTGELLGTRAWDLLRELAGSANDMADSRLVKGTWFPRSMVRWIIKHEWVRHVDDLIERRLMLHLAGPVRSDTREELASLLADSR
jgi:glycerol-3-phosphate dehydrogenase